MADLLKIRQEQKSRKPNFIRQRYHTKASLGLHWRKPKQKQSKLRRGKRGHRAMPSPGYGSPASVRGLDRSGLVPVKVSNEQQLSDMKKGEGAVIASTVGAKKRLAIVELAVKNNIKLLNIKDAKKFIEDAKKAFEERIAKKKSEAEKKKAEKAKKVKEKKTQKEEAKEEKTKAPDQKLAEEKKEKDKILTQKK